jgi:hypothetical protein
MPLVFEWWIALVFFVGGGIFFRARMFDTRLRRDGCRDLCDA